MSLVEQLKDQLSRFSLRAYERKLVAAAGGNNSVRIGSTEEFLITASGISLGLVRPDNILTVDRRGRKIAGPDGLVPSKETAMHLAVYNLRPDVSAIVHVHPCFCNIWAARGRSIPLATVTAKAKLGLTPIVPPAAAGSQELRASVENLIPTLEGAVHTILLQRHGILTWGATIEEAYLRADLAEEQAALAYFMELGLVSPAW